VDGVGMTRGAIASTSFAGPDNAATSRRRAGGVVARGPAPGALGGNRQKTMRGSGRL